MRITLSKLSLSNFRSVAQCSLELPRQGLILVDGPSGAGKTTIFQGISHVLSAGDFTSAEIQSWNSEDKPQASLVLAADRGSVAGECQFSRVGAGWFIDGKKVASAVEAAGKVQSFFGGLSPELTRTLTYLRQNERQDFLSLDSAGKYDFLSALLPDIARLEECGEAAKVQSEALRIEIEKLEYGQKTLAAVVAGVEDRLKTEGLLLEKEQAARVELEARLREEMTAQERRDAEFSAAKTQAEERLLKIKKARAEKAAEIEEKIRLVEQQKNDLLRGFKARPTPETAAALQEAEGKLSACRIHLQKAEGQEAVRRSAFDAEVQQINGEERQAAVQIGGMRGTLARRPVIQKEIEALQANLCPTCSRPWDQSEVKLRALSAELAEMKEMEQRLATAEAARLQLVERRKALVWQPSELIGKLHQIRDFLDAEVKRLRSLALNEESKSGAEFSINSIGPLDREIQTLRKGFDFGLEEEHKILSEWPLPNVSLQQALSNLKSEVVAKTRDISTKSKNIRDQQAGLDSSKKQLEEMESRRSVFVEQRRLESAISEVLSRRGFLAMIFQELLDEIAREANVTLGRVSNVSEVTLSFTTESETKGGKVRREIRVASTVRGNKTSLHAGVSGGMNNAIRLAVQLAIRKVVSRRMGIFPGWLILDEPFDGMRAAEKEAAMELLAHAAQDDLILVVDHATEFKGMFGKTIVVTMNKGVSEVRMEDV